MKGTLKNWLGINKIGGNLGSLKYDLEKKINDLSSRIGNIKIPADKFENYEECYSCGHLVRKSRMTANPILVREKKVEPASYTSFLTTINFTFSASGIVNNESTTVYLCKNCEKVDVNKIK